MSDPTPGRPADDPSSQHETGSYELRLDGRLDDRWATWFDGMTLTVEPNGVTVLRGRVVDQSALHGLLSRLRDLGIPLISVVRTDPDPPAPFLQHPIGE